MKEDILIEGVKIYQEKGGQEMRKFFEENSSSLKQLQGICLRSK